MQQDLMKSNSGRRAELLHHYSRLQAIAIPIFQSSTTHSWTCYTHTRISAPKTKGTATSVEHMGVSILN
uniref:Uncharacterized protein n=1 Tax=Arundo donax TaxID=35708 RepID=A0A0A9DDC1_ARUDO